MPQTASFRSMVQRHARQHTRDGRALRKPRHFFGRKGPDFWQSVQGALIEIYPDLADKLETLPAPPPLDAVPQRPRLLVVDDHPNFEKFLASRLAGRCPCPAQVVRQPGCSSTRCAGS